MTKSRLLAVLILAAALSACGGKNPKPLDCEEGLKYQDRSVSKRVVVPEGLDPLEEYAEMPIPKADPDAAPTAPGTCIDMPPPVGKT